MLVIENLHASYDSTPVLRGIDLEVDEGEVVGVIGKNGAGKTTLMKSVIGLLEPDSGTIRFDGRDVTDEPADVRARGGMGYIPQGRDVFSLPDRRGEPSHGRVDQRGKRAAVRCDL